jgi:histone-lysine N-methyltransferase SETDB1
MTFFLQLYLFIFLLIKRLPAKVNTGIFECNSKCKCNHRCSNRVVQNGISLRLQLFKTANKGWAVRCMDDIPKGTFICTYAGDIFTESQSDIRGKKLGDEYLTELDFLRKLRKNLRNEPNSSSSDEDNEKKGQNENDCIILDSDEEETEDQNVIGTNETENYEYRRFRNGNQKKKSRKMMTSKRFFTNPNSSFYIENILKDKRMFIVDPKTCGNIGRFFNHSCSPNIFGQNVFVNTYDLKFPLIAFFSSENIKAGTELCWDYDYKIGSVKGRELVCNCKSEKCRGRLL